MLQEKANLYPLLGIGPSSRRGRGFIRCGFKRIEIIKLVKEGWLKCGKYEIVTEMMCGLRVRDYRDGAPS